MEPELVLKKFGELRDRYLAFLKNEGGNAPLRRGQMTIAIVSEQVMDNPTYFSATGQSSHYFGADGTLSPTGKSFPAPRA